MILGHPRIVATKDVKGNLSLVVGGSAEDLGLLAREHAGPNDWREDTAKGLESHRLGQPRIHNRWARGLHGHSRDGSAAGAGCKCGHGNPALSHIVCPTLSQLRR